MLNPPALLSHIRCALDMQYTYRADHVSISIGSCERSHLRLCGVLRVPLVPDCSQVKERKDTLAQYETLDNGKPISEAAWDIVRR